MTICKTLPRVIRQGLVLLAIALPAAASQASDLDFASIETAPWASFDKETGEPVGAFPAVVRELAKRSGLDLSIALRPFARIFPELESGEQDCTILMWSENRADILKRGETVYQMPFGVIARNGVELKKYEDLNKLTISVLRGLKINAKFDGDNSLRKDSDTNYLTGLRKIAHKRLDAIAGALPTIHYVADQDEFANVLGDHLVLRKVPIALQCSHKSDKLDRMPELNALITAMREDGTLEKLLRDNYYY